MKSACTISLLVVAAASGQIFTYPSGRAAGCIRPVGSEYGADAVCTVPNETPLGRFTIPGAGTQFTDSNFGGKMRVLTDSESQHTYSTISPFSATGKYVALRTARGTTIVEAATGRVAFDEQPGNVAAAGVLWDGSNDDVYYYLIGAQLRKRVLSARQTTTLIDYGATHGFTSISNGGTGDTTADNWLSFWAPAQQKVCAVDIDDRKTYCASYTASATGNRVGWDFIDFALMSKARDSVTGKRYVLLMAKPAIGVYSVDMAKGNLRFEHRGPEMPLTTQAGASSRGNGDGVCDPGEACLSSSHSDVFSGADGVQYHLVLEDSYKPCGRMVTTYAIGKGLNMVRPVAEGGGRRHITMIHACGTDVNWSSQHVGCAKKVAACAISSNYPGAARNPTNLLAPLLRGPFSSEIFLVRGDGTEIRRLTQTRSVPFVNDTYWTTPRAAMSHDGTRILFSSNFGHSDRHRSVVLTTGN